MVKLRNFKVIDAAVLRQEKFCNMPIEQIQDMIVDWNRYEFKGNYFEMFAIIKDDRIVGMLSLFKLSDTVISIGPEVFTNYQRQGFGKQALTLALEICKDKGYQIACQQVLSDNAASIALHRSLGFETDGYCYKNQKGENVNIFLKSLN